MEGVLLVQNERYAIVSMETIPQRITQELASLDQPSPGRCVIDRCSANVLLVRTDGIITWNFAKGSAPRSFPVRRNGSGGLNGNLVSMVTDRSSLRHDPGLLLCTPEGELRFWESLTHSLPDAFRSLDLGLAPQDNAVFLTPAEPAGYIVATKNGLLFQIFLTNALGQLGLTYSQLSRPMGYFAKVGSMFGMGGSSSEQPIKVLSQSTDSSHARAIYLLTPKSLQKWIVSKSTPEKFVSEQNIQGVIANALASKMASLSAGFGLNGPVVIKDMATSEEGLVFLCAFQGSANEIRYALVTTSTSDLKVERITIMVHTAETDDNISLSVLNGGPLVLVYSSSFLILQATHEGFEEEKIFLKKSQDQILGCDTTFVPPYSVLSQKAGFATLLCSVSGLLHLEVAFNSEGRTGALTDQSLKEKHTSDLRKALTSHLLYGDENPVSIDFKQCASGDLNQVVKELCPGKTRAGGLFDAGLFSAATVTDIRPFLADKLLKAEQLATACLDFEGQFLLTDESKVHSSAEAQLRSALWQRVCEVTGLRYEENFLRNRLAHQIHTLSLLVEAVISVGKEDSGREFTPLVLTLCSKLVATLCEYREKKLATLLIPTGQITTPSWLVSRNFLSGLCEIYGNQELGDPRIQVAELAEALLWSYQEDARVTQRPSYHPEVLRLLVKWNPGEVKKAFDLAERYRQLPSLVEMSLATSPKEQHRRILLYFDCFKNEFAEILFDWCLAKEDSIPFLLQLPDEFNEVLDIYLSDKNRPDLAWIHKIRLQDFLGAATGLQKTSESAKTVSSQNMFLSLKKLASFAQGIDVMEVDNQLDTITSQEKGVEILSRASPELDQNATKMHFDRLLRRAKLNEPLKNGELVDLLSIGAQRISRDQGDAKLQLFVMALEVSARSQEKEQLTKTCWRRVLLSDPWDQFKAQFDEELEKTLDGSVISTILANVSDSLKKEGIEHLKLPSSLRFKAASSHHFLGYQAAEVEDLIREFGQENKGLDDIIHSTEQAVHSYFGLLEVIIKQPL